MSKRLVKTLIAGALATCALTGAARADSYEDGQIAYQRGDYDAALTLCRPLAERGDAQCQYVLGLAYGLGRGVRRDYGAAAKWYRLAADQGVAEAATNLGTLYANGKGVPQDYAQALLWWRKAID